MEFAGYLMAHPEWKENIEETKDISDMLDRAEKSVKKVIGKAHSSVDLSVKKSCNFIQ